MSEDRDGGRTGGRDLPLAVVSGLLLAGLFIGTLVWHAAAFTLLVSALMLLALVEASRVLHDRGHRVALPVLVAAGAILLGGAYLAGQPGQVVGVLALFAGAVAWELADHDRRDAFRGIAATCLIGLWVPFLASFAVLLVRRPVEAPLAVLATIGAAVLTDIGGFVFGTLFGRHRIAPTISPKKSWEGVAGGLALATAAAVAVLPPLGDLFDPASAAVLAVAVGLASILGDLVESMVKRDLGTKDFGSVLPGHGGVLDRVDGILFALPVGYYVLELLGR